MGNIIIGVLFIIGGLSGNFVLRGTNSGGALMGLGVILIIWGIVQLSRGKKKADLEAVAEIVGDNRKPFSAIGSPAQTLNFKAYDKNSQSYIGKIIKVDESKKTVSLQDDFGKEISRRFDDIEVLDEVEKMDKRLV